MSVEAEPSEAQTDAPDIPESTSRPLVGSRRAQFASSALSGVLLSLAFPRFSLCELAWVALVPLLLVLRVTRGRRTVAVTYLFGFSWYYLNLWWWNTLTIFNPFIPVGAVLGCLYLSTILLLFTLPASFALRAAPRWLSPFLVSGAWVGVEYLHVFGDFAFPWNLLGLSQHRACLLPLIQCADLAGVFGVSFLVILVNAAVAEVLASLAETHGLRTDVRTRIAMTRALVPLLIAVALVGVAFIYGSARMSQIRLRQSEAGRGTSRPIKVAVIQPNISQLLKWETYDPETSDSRRTEIESMVIRRLFAMVQAVSDQRPDLYILPETAFTDPYFVYGDVLHRQLGALASKVGGDVLFGADNRIPFDEYRADRRARGFGATATSHTLPRLAVRVDDRGDTVPCEPKPMAVFNSIWQAKPEIGLSGIVYNKIQLVPFGETAPIVDMIPLIQEKVLMVGSFQKGYEYTIFETTGKRYGSMVCFESAFAWLARGLARKGAQMLCVLTNDAWYDPSYLVDVRGFWGALFRVPVLGTYAASGPDQHLIHSIFRAVETRLPLVRVANTGTSCLILPDGTVARTLPWRAQGSFVKTVFPEGHSSTLYVRWGDWLAQLCLVVTLMLLALLFRQHRATYRRVSAESGQ